MYRQLYPGEAPKTSKNSMKAIGLLDEASQGSLDGGPSQRLPATQENGRKSLLDKTGALTKGFSTGYSMKMSPKNLNSQRFAMGMMTQRHRSTNVSVFR